MSARDDAFWAKVDEVGDCWNFTHNDLDRVS